MLYLETVESSTLELLKKLQRLPVLEQTRLVGGTALALQLGHRKSIDLDFFGTVELKAKAGQPDFRHFLQPIQRSVSTLQWRLKASGNSSLSA